MREGRSGFLVALLLVALGACAPPSAPVSACDSASALAATGLSNARDLGGVPLADGAVACGRIFRGEALSTLSAGGCDAFGQLGIATIVDLRTPSERLAAPDLTCAQRGAELILAPMPTPSSVSPADYLADLHAEGAVAAAFGAFGDEARYPVYVHCVYGRDRTGVLAALILLSLGATRAEVLADYQRSTAAGLATFPESLGAVLDELEAPPGVEAQLEAAGVSADALATLRRLAQVSSPR